MAYSTSTSSPDTSQVISIVSPPSAFREASSPSSSIKASAGEGRAAGGGGFVVIDLQVLVKDIVHPFCISLQTSFLVLTLVFSFMGISIL